MVDTSRDIDGNGLTGIKISRKQQQMANARANGKSLKEIAVIHYPGATEASGVVQVSRQMNLPHVAKYLEQSKLMALKEHNITWSRIIRPITDALDFSEGKPVENINVRLKGSKMASEFIESKQMDTEVKEQLLNLPNVDEIQLVRLLKK